MNSGFSNGLRLVPVRFYVSSRGNTRSSAFARRWRFIKAAAASFFSPSAAIRASDLDEFRQTIYTSSSSFSPEPYNGCPSQLHEEVRAGGSRPSPTHAGDEAFCNTAPLQVQIGKEDWVSYDWFQAAWAEQWHPLPCQSQITESTVVHRGAQPFAHASF